MTIEAKIDRTNELLEQLLAKLGHVGQSLGEVPRVEQTASEETNGADPWNDPELVAAAKTAGKSPFVYYYEKHIQPKVLKVSSVKGADTARKLLADLGLKSAKEAKPDQWPKIIAACDEALK
jgi:hypothetical protein